MASTLQIDFVSDVSCPWCAIGLTALEQALQQVQPEVTAQIHLQPFELNPDMPAGGQDIGEHLAQKYDSTSEQQAQIRATIAQRGADVGFAFSPDGRDRIYNTFDARRLLHWAGLESAAQQLALKKTLLAAEVRAAETFFTGQGIHSMPAIIINSKHLIPGGQPVAVFAQALRQIASEGL